jgi:hypothetical protein
MEDGDALAGFEDALDLVPEDDAGGMPELLDIGAAKAARADMDEDAVALRLRELGELREPIRVEDDRAHRPHYRAVRAASPETGSGDYT